MMTIQTQTLTESLPEINQTSTPLHLNSILKELLLYSVEIDVSHLGKELAKTFDDYPLIPGILLTEKGRIITMISRRNFLEIMTRPYSLELFMKRPIKSLLEIINNQFLICSGEMTIVDAAKKSLKRPPELLYEPILVDLGHQQYAIADVHQLLLAQSEIHELTTKKLAQESQSLMIQTEKMASLGEMVAGIAHEIRNPINFIHGNFEFLTNHAESIIKMLQFYLKNSPNSPEIQEMLEELDLEFAIKDLPEIINSMKTGSTRLIKIISSLQNFSRLDENQPQKADIYDCLDSTLLILNNRLKAISVQKQSVDLPLISCYPGQLSQVFMNIISNAIDALQEKLETSANSNSNWLPKIWITTQVVKDEQNSWLSIRIADNGNGIPQEVLPHIFDSFFTTKPMGKGTGLGLAISHQIITEKHGGRLLVYSQEEKGTQFDIIIPFILE
jgi:two-component system, NtrC family, sensor kinase